MDNPIDLENDSEIDEKRPGKSPITIRQVKNVTNLDSITVHFPKELKKIALEDIIETDISIAKFLERITNMRYNRMLLKGERNNIVIDIDIILGEYTAFRNRKIICTGTYKDCQMAIYNQINKELGNRFANSPVVEFDEIQIKNICKVHWDNPDKLRIIKL